MFLKYRPIQRADLKECLLCLRDRFAYNDVSQIGLLQLWQQGLENGTLQGHLMEDQTAPVGHDIFYFCIRAFVSDAYALWLRTNAPPLLGLEVLMLWRAGHPPLLSRSQIAAANSGIGDGLNMILLHSGAPDFKEGGNIPLLANKVAQWIFSSGGGYRLREYLVEALGLQESAWAEAAGLVLRRDYGQLRQAHGVDIPSGKSPRLYGITPVEMQLSTVAAVMFQWQPPRFFFTESEQWLLLHALAGDTDAELAAALYLAPVTIKKRWQSIYQRVEKARPGLLSDDMLLVLPKRGTERKRRLLRYLHHHMEELRSVLPDSDAGH